MKGTAAWAWAAAAVAVVAGTPEGLKNPGFETGSVEGWNAWDAAQRSQVTRHPGGAHSGEFYLEIELDPGKDIGGYVQNVFGFLTWEDRFRAEAWVRTEELQGQQAYLMVEFFDEDWARYGKLESQRVTGTCGWTQLSFTGKVPSRQAIQRLDKIHFVLCVEGEKKNGRVFFDDARIEKIEIPPRKPE